LENYSIIQNQRTLDRPRNLRMTIFYIVADSYYSWRHFS